MELLKLRQIITSTETTGLRNLNSVEIAITIATITNCFHAIHLQWLRGFQTDGIVLILPMNAKERAKYIFTGAESRKMLATQFLDECIILYGRVGISIHILGIRTSKWLDRVWYLW